eukprot:TRINITY_DN17403_c0_g1_i1.p1 TRINITY_DN17403_c0_g1~~TRINITY_DN17403_c0_g1_i1.p1  ORF type:complete len:862 (+),score=216.49 TRINITY_DN17403_c0_g1_i1:51-2636(+)
MVLKGVQLLVAAAAVVVAEGRGEWCVAEKAAQGHAREFRGTFRDFSMYAGVGKVPACKDITKHVEGNDGLWVLEFDKESDYTNAKERLQAANMKIFFDSGKLSFVTNGGTQLTDIVGLDGCGGEVGTSVIPVSATKVIPSPGPSDELLTRGALRNDPVIAAAVSHVSESELVDFVTKLQSYHTRNSYSTEVAEAGQWIEKQYEAYGFATETHRFREDMSPNLIATLKGKTNPEKVIVVGAHYDSRSTNSNSKTQRAPGGDDNASGTSALLELARVIFTRKLSFDYTIKLCSFSGEEQGLLGSAAQARLWKQQGMAIEAMFNADMLGYQIPTDPITMGFKDRHIDHALTEQVMRITEDYTGLPTAYSASCCSDYKSFHDEGYVAVGFFENAIAASSYPHYHKSTDLLEYINTEQLQKEVQAIVATVMTYAHVVHDKLDDVLPSRDTFIYLAPIDTVGGAVVPNLNRTVVALYDKLATVPVGWNAVRINPSVPKYLVRSRHHDDRENLKAAYGSDLIQISEQFFIMATEEIGERKAHSCGILTLKPQPGSVKASMMKSPRAGMTTAQKNQEKAFYMNLVTEGLVQSILRPLSGDEPIVVNGVSERVATRYSFVEWNKKAAEWIGEYMIKHAACDDVVYQEFAVRREMTRNVICKKIGLTQPDDIVVIGAHFDSISSANGGKSAEFAPGAIDNGSGSTNVMAVAQALKNFKNDKTIHFILFSGEEQGLYGSTHYVDVALKEGLKIDVALIMDMTAYSAKHFGVTFEGTTSPAIRAVMDNAEDNLAYLKETLGSNLATNHVTRSFGSDHVPFQKAGIPAILHIELDDTDYPGYHKTTDTVSYANYLQMRDIGRVILGQVYDYSTA